jgi:hypothetical protein
MDFLANYDSDEDDCIIEQKIEEPEENIVKTVELNRNASSRGKFLKNIRWVLFFKLRAN